jgi:Flp pilus assembly protein TadG
MINRFLSRLRACSRGVMAIESVIVAPVLILMALGAFQMGTLVSRQQELQSGASDVVSIILAANASNGNGVSSSDIKAVVKNSLNLADNEITLLQRYRCGASATLTEDANSCASGEQRYEYVVLQLTDTVTPTWVKYGMGRPFTFTVNRTVQIK